MIINKKSRNKKIKNNILTISQIASNAKRENPNVINATSGMLCDENSNLYTFNSCINAMNDISYNQMFKYSDTIGSSKYKQAIIDWVFSSHINDFSSHHIEVVATPGGSGAISLTFSSYLNKGDKVLLPNIMWEPYITFASERECSYLSYNLYDKDGCFDIDSIKNCIDQLENQENIVIVINDPCQNPTGFCMKDEDYDKLVDLLNSYSRNFVLLMDVAYFDYYSSNGEIIRNRYAKLASLNENCLLVFAFSGSKTFGLYGLRIGAAICVTRDKEEVNYFKDCFEFIARANWSSSSTFGSSLIEQLILNDKYKNQFKNEIETMSSKLKERANIFIDKAKECGLNTLPFECGFFVCVPTNDPQRLMEALRKDNVYVVTTKTCIRIAICAINKDECSILPSIIKQRIELENLDNN